MRKLQIAIATLLIIFVGKGFAQQAHINEDWDPMRNKENLVPFSANVISPEVMDDRTVILSVARSRK